MPLAVLIGGLAFAVFLPLTSTGIGWPLAGLVAGGAAAYLARRGAAAGRGLRLARAGWGAASLALLSVLAFRNAWWLVTFCVLGALGCATLALVTGRATRSILFSVVAVPVAALRGLPWLRRHAGALVGDRQRRAAVRVALSVVVTLAMLAVFGGLLASADAAFAELISRMVPEAGGGTAFRAVFLFVAGALTVTAAAYLLAAPPDLSSMDSPGRERLGRVEWALPIGALVLLFTGFVVVQVAVLFGGRRHVLHTAGLTYAEYARSGFWQLVAVTVLTLVVVAATTRWARRGTPGDRLLLRVAFGLLCGLSIVIVASALFRMYTYQQAYSFTGERIFVMAFEMLLGSVFVMVLLAGIRLNGRWIPATTVALTAIMLLSLAALNPEGYAAQRNVARYQTTGKIDLWYLRALSADATPALATLPEKMRGCPLSWVSEDLREPDPWYAWNLGRQRARETLHRLADKPPGTCKGASRYDYGN